ncbi:glycosyltransferase involved in cell wall biosynthesis [Pseudorhizobium tarimense]|uniref:Glycosyltransferase involved in cell wall biosynthesis n=1 Tax=Pseudorhizobium tarimense TaxID=1079109 RepID=A0ABV2H4B0_9HYPH|nr:glycosyltransferase family 4 protein [Pseudorhizobium tarimense]
MKNAGVLSERGVLVEYFCGDFGRNGDLAKAGVAVHAVGANDLRSSSFAMAVARGLYNFSAARQLKSLIRSKDTPDTLYHVHNWSKILSPSIFDALRPVMDRVVLTAHDYFLACPNGGYFHFQRGVPCTAKPLSFGCLGANCDRRSRLEKTWRIARDIERRALMNLSGSLATVLAVHDGMIPLLERGGIPAGHIKSLRNPVESWSTERVRAEENREFLFVGRLEHDKGVILLAEAAKQAKVPITFVGEGALGSEIASINPDAKLVGFKDRAALREIAARVRCLVVPTRSRETFSLVAYEALTSGIPVIISDFATTRDEILESGVGIACNPYEAGALTRTLVELARDDDGVFRMSLEGFLHRHTLTLSSQDWERALLDVYCQQAKVAEIRHRALTRGGSGSAASLHLLG